MTILHIVDHIFFFNDTATTEIYTLSLHDALPISVLFFLIPLIGSSFIVLAILAFIIVSCYGGGFGTMPAFKDRKSNTSELQSRQYLVCRLLLEKKKRVALYLRCLQVLR